MAVRDDVLTVITEVAREQGRSLAPLSDELHLMDSGLDSLCIAVTVARLDERLGLDPFRDAEDMTLPVTVGEFIGIYENASRK